MASMSEQDVFQVKGHNLVFLTLALLFTHLVEPEPIESLGVGVNLLHHGQYSSASINWQMNWTDWIGIDSIERNSRYATRRDCHAVGKSEVLQYFPRHHNWKVERWAEMWGTNVHLREDISDSRSVSLMKLSSLLNFWTADFVQSPCLITSSTSSRSGWTYSGRVASSYSTYVKVSSVRKQNEKAEQGYIYIPSNSCGWPQSSWAAQRRQNDAYLYALSL